MNSGQPTTTPASATTPISLRQIRILTTLCAGALLALGGAMVATEGDWPLFGLEVAVLPAVLYSLAAFRYGRVFFGPAAPEVRRRAWSHWIWTGAILASLPYLVGSVVFFLDKELQAWLGPYPLWFVFIVLLIVLLFSLPPLLWARIADLAFLLPPQSPRQPFFSPQIRLGISLLTGSLLVLSSLVLNMNYSTPGWQVLAWHNEGWVTNWFIRIEALRISLNILFFAAYAAALLIALAALLAARQTLAEKPLKPSMRAPLLNASVLILWFMLTNYIGNCVSLAFLGFFSFIITAMDKFKFLLITAGWLALFVLGSVFWFRFSRSQSETAERGMTILLLGALPLLLVPLATAFTPHSFEIQGLVPFIAGLQILAACFWKLARTPQPVL